MPTKAKRILVVDDEDYWRKRVSEAVASRGHEFIMARDFRSGRRMLEGLTFDLVITDNLMEQRPNAGVELVQYLRRRIGAVPAILHTSELDPDMEKNLLGAFPKFAVVIKRREYTDGVLIEQMEELLNA